MEIVSDVLERVQFLVFFLITGGQGYLLLKPSYVSNWKAIQAQSEKAEVEFYHGLGSLPVKVVAEVKVVLGDGKTYIFDSVGTAQVTDSLNIPYGGIVSLYNETRVIVYAPKSSDSNGTTKGRVVFVGGAAWTGHLSSTNQNKEMPMSGLVRVRAWSDQDFPIPDFKQTSIPISVKQDDGYMGSFSHGLGKHPDYVIVQVRGTSSGLISEAQGSVSIFDHYTENSIISGVIFGHSENCINVWAPGTDVAYPTRKVFLFQVSEGWGNGNNSVSETSATLTIYAWTFYSTPDKWFSLNQGSVGYSLEHDPQSVTCSKLDNCLLSLDVQVQSGLYQKFRFRHVGSVMNDGIYGMTSGILHAYNNAVFYLWKPDLQINGKTEGFFVSIFGRWGNSSTYQRTNDVKVNLALWRQFSIYNIQCSGDTPRFLSIANASTVVSSQFYNSTLTMACHDSFKRTAGNVSVTCGRHGKWKGSPIQCQLITCPGDVGNSSIPNGWSYSDGVYLGNTTTSMCNDGYQLVDPSSTYRICQENETWSNTDPLCIYNIQCSGDTPRFLNIANASTVVSSQSYNSTLTMACHDSFKKTAGNVSVTCGTNGKWEGSPIHCQLITCPGDVGNSSIPNGWSYSDGVYLGNTTTSMCNDGYQLVEPSSRYRVCLENETWSNSDPQCTRVKCSPDLEVIGSTYSAVGTQYMDTVVYRCLPGYPYLSGNLTRTCQTNGEWSGVKPTCQGCYCDCTSDNNVVNISLEDALKEIIRELKLNKQETSLNRRSKISVYEDRPLAKGIGVIGCSILACVFSTIVIPDIFKLLKSIKSLFFNKSSPKQQIGTMKRKSKLTDPL